MPVNNISEYSSACCFPEHDSVMHLIHWIVWTYRSRSKILWFLMFSIKFWTFFFFFYVGSSRTRARTHVPCISRWILNHCATREAQILDFLNIRLRHKWLNHQDFHPLSTFDEFLHLMDVVVRKRVGKEFPDTRQNVKKIEFIRGKGRCQNSGPTS